jgi:hypothetical protein
MSKPRPESPAPSYAKRNRRSKTAQRSVHSSRAFTWPNFLIRSAGRRPILIRSAIIVSVVAILGVGTSVAYWTPVGGGAGAAAVGSIAPVAVSAVAIPSMALSPDGPVVPVSVTLTNPNSFPVTITKITAAAFTSDKPGCGVDENSPTGVDLDFDVSAVPAFVGSMAVVGQASMGLNSVSACQGATFSTVLTAEVRR